MLSSNILKSKFEPKSKTTHQDLIQNATILITYPSSFTLVGGCVGGVWILDCSEDKDGYIKSC
jgi:hypothetical protein